MIHWLVYLQRIFVKAGAAVLAAVAVVIVIQFPLLEKHQNE